MVEMNHNAVTIGASDTTIKSGHGVVVAVHVTLIGSSGDKLVLRNGTTNSDPIEFEVHGEAVQNIIQINRRFEDGIRADVTGNTARYLIVYK
tara:strand:- start:1191 stop:1466 length:276 start_codon:yes stop_codon:yes gene_type:complete